VYEPTPVSTSRDDVPILLLTAQSPFPGANALAPVLGTALLGTPVVPLHRLPALGEPPARPIYGWPMLDIDKWAEPVPMKGAQGFWEMRT